MNTILFIIIGFAVAFVFIARPARPALREIQLPDKNEEAFHRFKQRLAEFANAHPVQPISEGV